MINQAIVTHVVLNRPGLVNKPLWQQLALQLAFVAAAGLLAGWFLIGEVRLVVIGIEEQTVQVRLDVGELQQKLDAMPLLSVLRMQLAAKTAQDEPFQPERLAQLIAEPLSLAGASLLSWQPAPPHAGAPHQERWQLAFSANYTGVLQVLHELAALPYVLRITQLAIKPDAAPTALSSEIPRLQVELSLIRPEAVP
ncbi:hypothetical protein LOZ86_02895 [Pectobacterium parvum]|uniref:Pilus assembly protein PilO n=1 Tax=Pectobacterium parvum TaxID=2778550 RepID=A0ABW8FXQ6_9GAMM|nr:MULTISPECIES: hypothetical protein [Pectobacterium]GKW42002.1 hypothetical protein PEC301879_18600 [Pectobacterium carotovorum subsp. carotovorum]KFX13781.1 hypothetical protein KP17_10855 [Pectobacterium parvum]KHS98573.1 hypothetical protein RC88_03440 [Pectobacterium parvum]MCU1801750.1 hypothetical protein [Pectobacterium parvum]UFK39861.1 hypothetical protein LOZ86_02895 [Pectobacterium parvum]